MFLHIEQKIRCTRKIHVLSTINIQNPVCISSQSLQFSSVKIKLGLLFGLHIRNVMQWRSRDEVTWLKYYNCFHFYFWTYVLPGNTAILKFFFFRIQTRISKRSLIEGKKLEKRKYQ